MLTLVKNFFFILASLGIASFLVISSIVFGQSSQSSGTHEYVEGSEIKKYVIMEGLTEDKAKTLIYKQVSPGQTPQYDKGSVLYADFGRLASAFLLPGTGSTFTSTDVLSLSGREVTLKQGDPTIISLYDPFSTYTIRSAGGDYSINQVTNGSFYIGTELNNTVSLYSIDAVIKLNFLFEGEHMADIVLFPGMYVRFNPSFNRIFKGVTDPFRVAQVVGSDDVQDVTGTTGIEFVNPRMESGDDKDTFFVYRLPPNTRILFQMLHTMFHDKVAQIDIMKSYANDLAFSSDASSNTWLQNPSKINHFLLLELKATLSQGLQSQTTFEAFTRKISDIRKRAEVLAIGNSVNKTFEEFLTDGRFALFASTVSAKYEKIYSEVASIVGIIPSGGKAKLFQKLSDIYSHNLVTQKKDLTFSKIDTYSPTASELQATMTSDDINHKDYFDIALYAFSLLEKARNGQLFETQAITAHATYQLLSTLFVATSKYASSVEDPDQQAKTYRSIALNFYDPVLRVLARSFYAYYTVTDEKGHIFLNEKVLSSEGKIKMNRDLIRDIKAIDSTVRGVLAEIQPAYVNETDMSTLLSIKRSSLRIRGFAGILQDDAYLSYQLHPYLAASDGDINLPQLSDDSSVIIVYTPEEVTPVEVAPAIQETGAVLTPAPIQTESTPVVIPTETQSGQTTDVVTQ